MMGSSHMTGKWHLDSRERTPLFGLINPGVLVWISNTSSWTGPKHCKPTEQCQLCPQQDTIVSLWGQFFPQGAIELHTSYAQWMPVMW